MCTKVARAISPSSPPPPPRQSPFRSPSPPPKTLLLPSKTPLPPSLVRPSVRLSVYRYPSHIHHQLFPRLNSLHPSIPPSLPPKQPTSTMPYSPPPSQQLPRFAPYVNNTSPPPSQHTMHSSPFNTSPTSPFSPHIPAPCRQLHPPKVPLYRPAVLRSIERPIRAAREPLTPPASSAASLNEVYIGDVEYKTGVDFRGFGYGNCAYSNVTDLGEIEDDDVQVTEEPDRGHWKVFIIFLQYYCFFSPLGSRLPIPVFTPSCIVCGIRTIALCVDLKRSEVVYP